MKTELSDLKLVAYFMGLRVEQHGNYLYDYSGGPDQIETIYAPNGGWVDLMPACAKFSNLEIDDFNLNLPEGEMDHVDHVAAIAEAILEFDIQKTFEKLVEGIRWYNNTKS